MRRRRIILTLAAVIVFIAAIGTVKLLRIQAAIAQGASFQPPPEAVTTIVAGLAPWESTVKAIGTITAVQGVLVSADLPGIVEKIAFTSGREVRAGDLLVQLDAAQERAQLRAEEAHAELAKLTLDRLAGLLVKGVVSQAEFDRASAEFRQAEAGANGIRAAIARKTIRAPFVGVLGIRQVNLGQFLKSGDPIVSLQARRPVFADFSVPQQQIGNIRPGGQARLKADGAGDRAFQGRITAVDAVIDASTRNVRIQATFDNEEGTLRPGMFAEIEIPLLEGASAVALPASAIRYAPYGDAVFVVEDLRAPDGTTYRGVRQQFVKLGGARGDQVAILSGIDPGSEVVTSGVFKLRNGAAVQVNNDIQPANDPTPVPEEG